MQPLIEAAALLLLATTSDKDLSGLLLGSEVSWGVSMTSDLRVTYPTHLLDRDLQYLESDLLHQ